MPEDYSFTGTYPVRFTQSQFGYRPFPEMTLFIYNRAHLPDGSQETDTVWLFRRSDLYELLNYWNAQSDEWKYYA